MIEIRRIGPDQWTLLRTVRLAALADAPEAFESTYAATLDFGEDYWRGRAETDAAFLAFDGAASDEAVGMAICAHDDGTHPSWRSLISMWVAPPARGRGLAGRLVTAVADHARADGARELYLWVVVGNAAARAAYARAGFAATGQRQPVRGPGNRAEDRLRLTL